MYTVCTQINESLKKHFADIERATRYSIIDISAELFSKGLISEAVKESPTYYKIFNEFKAGLSLVSDISMLVQRYKIFLDCLKCNGGPSSQDVIDSLISEWFSLISEWKTNESQSKL